MSCRYVLRIKYNTTRKNFDRRVLDTDIFILVQPFFARLSAYHVVSVFYHFEACHLYFYGNMPKANTNFLFCKCPNVQIFDGNLLFCNLNIKDLSCLRFASVASSDAERSRRDTNQDYSAIASKQYNIIDKITKIYIFFNECCEIVFFFLLFHKHTYRKYNEKLLSNYNLYQCVDNLFLSTHVFKTFGL